MPASKPAPSATSSDDLAQARILARALREGVPPAQSHGAYVSFPAAAKAPPAPPAPPRVTPVPSGPLLARREPLEAPRAGFGPATWNALLEASAKAVSAQSGFLMNSQGLIIASRGRPNDELEALGARLMVIFEHADRLDPSGFGAVLSLTLEAPRGTIHGLRLTQGEEQLTLGLSVPGGLTADRQARLVQILTANRPPAHGP